MLWKAKIFSPGIMHIYILDCTVYILCECVTFSRQSSTYNQPFNKWHIQIKCQQLYLITKLCRFIHFICTLNNNNKKFSWSLAIRCSQLRGIRDVKQTDMEQPWKTGAKNKTGQAWSSDLMIKEVPKQHFCAIAAILTSGAAASSATSRAQLDWHQFLSGRTALRTINTLPSKAALGQPPFSNTSAAVMNCGAEHIKQRRRREGEGEKRGLRA